MISFRPLYTGVVDFDLADEQLSRGWFSHAALDGEASASAPAAEPPIRIQGDRYGPRPHPSNASALNLW